jgi:hypothetical protein
MSGRVHGKLSHDVGDVRGTTRRERRRARQAAPLILCQCTATASGEAYTGPKSTLSLSIIRGTLQYGLAR